jgi:hypothetical protein
MCLCNKDKTDQKFDRVASAPWRVHRDRRGVSLCENSIPSNYVWLQRQVALECRDPSMHSSLFIRRGINQSSRVPSHVSQEQIPTSPERHRRYRFVVVQRQSIRPDLHTECVSHERKGQTSPSSRGTLYSMATISTSQQSFSDVTMDLFVLSGHSDEISQSIG